MDTTLTSFIWVWITLILIVNLFGIVGLLIGADSTWQALQEVKEIYSPFNVMNWLLVLRLHNRRRHQVQNQGHCTSGIDLHRPYLCQRQHRHCSLDMFSVCASKASRASPLP